MAGKHRSRTGKRGKATSRRDHAQRSEANSSETIHGTLLYGRHAVEAALANPKRNITRLMAAKADLLPSNPPANNCPNAEIVARHELDALVGGDANHQGVIAIADPLPRSHIESLLVDGGPNLVIALDQVTDPHNVGAVLRSAAAFGADALITTDRHAPTESGALAKAASGALEAVPWVRVANLARALDQLAEAGYWRIGLDGNSDTNLEALDLSGRTVLVLGSEGKGLRPLVAKSCDHVAKLQISDKVESLNISNAAAVGLYVCSRTNLEG